MTLTNYSRLTHAPWCLLALLASAAALAAPITAVPPAQYEGRGHARADALVVAAVPEVPAMRIELAPVTPADERTVHAANAATDPESGKGRPLAIGFGRDVAVAQQTIALSNLVWRTDAGGSRYARIDIASLGAKAIRAALKLDGVPAGLYFGFSGSGVDAASFEASGAAIAAGAVDGPFWSPVVDGDVLHIVLRAEPASDIAKAQLVIPRVSHLLVDAAGQNPFAGKAQKAVGSSGACNIDVACVVPATAAFTDMTRAVVRISFTQDNGFSYLCTATLLNDSVTSFTPYVLTANHCINSARAARTINSYWFYNATACGSQTPQPFVQLAGGAALLGRSQDRDWALVRLNDVVPATAYFAAWRAEALAVNDSVSTIHHPRGDLKKWARGTSMGEIFFDDFDAIGFFNSVVWQQGTTESGSSGSPLLTFSTTGGYYEVRGGLFAGEASCSNLSGVDMFSQFQASLPLLRQYLTPDSATPGGQVAATEFYNATLNHYFVSTNPVEIAKLDSGATVGWERTGLRFLVYNAPAPGTSAVCRFYRAPAYGDSHFYSASSTECANTAAAHPVDWIYESPNVFYSVLPDTITGACPSGTSPVYRFFNVNTTNHRYTTELTLRNQLATTASWVAEGYGPGPYFPVMCAVAP